MGDLHQSGRDARTAHHPVRLCLLGGIRLATVGINLLDGDCGSLFLMGACLLAAVLLAALLDRGNRRRRRGRQRRAPEGNGRTFTAGPSSPCVPLFCTALTLRWRPAFPLRPPGGIGHGVDFRAAERLCLRGADSANAPRHVEATGTGGRTCS